MEPSSVVEDFALASARIAKTRSQGFALLDMEDVTGSQTSRHPFGNYTRPMREPRQPLGWLRLRGVTRNISATAVQKPWADNNVQLPAWCPVIGKMNRRKFSKLCGMGVTGLALNPWKFARGAQLPAAPAGPLPGQVLTMDLGGTAWTFHQAAGTETLAAHVPGDHYSDLLRAGKIPDPYYRDNNKAVQWAAQTGWIYQRTFEATPQQLGMKNVEMVCHGLDTFATVTLNGTTLGSTNNMFRTWVYDVKQALKPGTNDLQINFKCCRSYRRSMT